MVFFIRWCEVERGRLQGVWDALNGNTFRLYVRDGGCMIDCTEEQKQSVVVKIEELDTLLSKAKNSMLRGRMRQQ